MNNKKEVKTKIKYLQKKKKQTMRNKHKDQKSIEQQFAEAKLVPEKDKEHFFDLVFDFLTSPDYAGDDRVLLDDNSKEKLKKYGNNIYYDGYRVIGISKDGWAQLDFNDTLPAENEIALVAGISKLISHPIKTISNIKKEVKLITDNGKEIIQEIGDIEKIFIDAIDNGEIVEAKGGGIRIFIGTGKPVGMVLDDGVWKSTTKIQFHAGKKGFHGVPYIGEKGVKK